MVAVKLFLIVKAVMELACIESRNPIQIPTSKTGLTKLMRRWITTITLLSVFFLTNQAEGGSDAISQNVSQSVDTAYSWSDGFVAGFIQLRSNGTFEYEQHGCTGLMEKASGRYSLSEKTIHFQPTDSGFKPDGGYFAYEMHRIHWGQREYLVPEADMINFVNHINSGDEPRLNTHFGYFYLRYGDDVIKVEGFPDLPGNWQSYLLPRPLSGVIRRVEQRETSKQRPIVFINAGAQKGLKKGMRLFAYNPRRPSFSADLEIIEVFVDSARVIVPLQYNHIRRMDLWSTRAPKD